MTQGLSIIIAAYDRPSLLRKTIESVTALAIPPDVAAEILIIASPQMTDAPAIVREAAARGGIPVRLVPELRPGLSHARNQGLKEAAHEHVAFFDDDVQVAPDWIHGYFDAVNRCNADCVVGPVTPQFERPVPDYFTDAVLELISAGYSRKGPELKKLPSVVAHEVPGCNFAVRKRVALEAGGFDPRLGRSANTLTGGDDFEFGWRLVLAGKTVAYQPACAVNHSISAEKLSKSWSRRRWYGLGIAIRFAFDLSGKKPPTAMAARSVYRIARLALGSVACRLCDQPGPAFERELRALKEAGFLIGPRTRRQTVS